MVVRPQSLSCLGISRTRRGPRGPTRRDGAALVGGPLRPDAVRRDHRRARGAALRAGDGRSSTPPPPPATPGSRDSIPTRRPGCEIGLPPWVRPKPPVCERRRGHRRRVAAPPSPVTARCAVGRGTRALDRAGRPFLDCRGGHGDRDAVRHLDRAGRDRRRVRRHPVVRDALGLRRRHLAHRNRPAATRLAATARGAASRPSTWCHRSWPASSAWPSCASGWRGPSRRIISPTWPPRWRRTCGPDCSPPTTGSTSPSPSPTSSPWWSVPPARLLGSVLLSASTVGAVLFVAVLVARERRSRRAAAAAVAGSLLVYLLGIGQGIWRRFNEQYRFTVALAPDGIRVRRGLLSTVSETIPIRPRPGRPPDRAPVVAPVGLVPPRGRPGRRARARAFAGGSGRMTKALLPVGSHDDGATTSARP